MAGRDRIPGFAVHQQSRETGDARKLEERQHERRTALPADSTHTDLRKHAERRRPEAPHEIQSREKSYRVWRSLDATRIAPTRVFIGIGIALCVLAVVSWQARRPESLQFVQCGSGPTAGVVWDFCDKQGANLNGVNLRGASLKNTNLSNAVLSAVKLESADLAYANLAAAKLLNADLRGANLTGAILRGADLTGADLTGAIRK